MYHCLYCRKDDKEVNFTSKEHVFPAGIGGIFQLPVGVVCDKCNTEYFSPLESDFIRNSPIAIARQFLGPGKRGSLNPSYVTSSSVHLMAKNDESGERLLGVISKGVPFQIPQFRFLGPENYTIFLDPRHGDVESQMVSFNGVMREFNKEKKFVHLSDNLLEENEFYFGFWKKKYYLCSRNRESISSVLELLEQLKIGNIYEKTERIYTKEIVESRQEFGFNVKAFERVCAKIAFNGLCYLKSQEYCLNPKFDAIRDFVLNGGNNKFVILMNREQSESLNTNLRDAFPQHSHRLHLFLIRNEGYHAHLNLYSSFNLVIRLTKGIAQEDSSIGIVCDWPNRHDITFTEYWHKLSKINESLM